ncbi:MAG: right-handed parallel beta-helix repeat-containing protein [Verrucomicrobiota bacterium]
MKTISLLILFSPLLSAGTWSTAEWTGDSSSGISTEKTVWAYHFGSATDTAVNGVTVTGIATGNPSAAGDFAITGVNFVFNNHFNDLTALTGTGSAVIARDFIYGGAPATITLSGLVTGASYTASVFGVGFNAPDARTSTFASGVDSLAVDENALGSGKGIRVDYAFTAAAATQIITVTPATTATFHLYGLALATEPITVTTAADEDDGSLGGGSGISLREAVRYAGSGATVYFDPALDGKTISFTAGEIEVAGDITIDAGSLPNGITLDGNHASTLFRILNGKSLTATGLTLTRGGLAGTQGGAIYNGGSLDLTRCTLSNNACNSGAAFSQNSDDSISKLSHCTITGNRALVDGATGGILIFRGVCQMDHCTVSGNTGTNFGGAIYLQSPGSLSLENCIIAGNKDSRANDIYRFSGTLTLIGSNLIGSNQTVSDLFPTGPLAGTQAAPLDPKLSPLARFGGNTMTLHPLVGSPAIDAGGATNPGGTDQRGYPRFTNGDGKGGAALDIGAVEAGPAVKVTTVIDEDNGSLGGGKGVSLREAVRYAANGSVIRFATKLSGTTITLGGKAIPISKNLFIDASSLVTPVTVSGNKASRILSVGGNSTLAIQRVRFTGGRGAKGKSNMPGQDGGGIRNSGSLALIDSTLTGNKSGEGGPYRGPLRSSGGNGGAIANFGTLQLILSRISNNSTGQGGLHIKKNLRGDTGDGGAIYNSGKLELRDSTLSGNSGNQSGGIRQHGSENAATSAEGCTFSGNSGISGGAFFNASGTTTMRNCTFSGNSVTSGGGAIENGGGATLAMTHCTLSGNTAGGFGGGAIYSSATLVLNHCIAAGNTPDNVTGAAFSGTQNLTSGDPLLAPLSNTGGPTATRLPLTGSPAIDAATTSTSPFDQRGVLRNGAPDIGAAEF